MVKNQDATLASPLPFEVAARQAVHLKSPFACAQMPRALKPPMGPIA